MFKMLMTRKGITLVVIPLFALFLQVFLRLILNKDLNTIGITLGALGLGQILPFFYFDHFVANKLLGIVPKYRFINGEFQITYQIQQGNNINESQIDSLKNWFILAIFLNLCLFLVIVYFGLCGKILLHTVFGVVSCSISWYLLIFK